LLLDRAGVLLRYSGGQPGGPVAVDDTGTREWLSHAKSSTLQVTCRWCPTAGVEGVGITVMVGAAGAARDLGRKQGQERVADVWAKVT
jgi:hypothetical protein